MNMTKPEDSTGQADTTASHSDTIRNLGTRSLWVQAFRPRTLPASIAPVFVGIASVIPVFHKLLTCVDIYPKPHQCVVNEQLYQQAMGRFWFVAVACIVVALFFQIAVNFANDYSDGVRGSDNERSGDEQASDKPQRLVASGVTPKYVLAAAAISALIAAIAGIIAIVLTGHYWFLAVGLACLAACWFYTGGKHPYGYIGLGELSVFLFFGIAATLGTQYLLAGAVDRMGILGAINTGLLSSVMLMVNNIRDIDDDLISGKRTLAARLGHTWAQRSVYLMLVIPVATVIFFAVISILAGGLWWLVAMLALLNVACATIAVRTLHGSNPHKFGKALAFSGFILLSYAAVHVVAMLELL